MKFTTFALAAALLAAPALAQDVAPPSDTVKAVVEKGVSMEVMGQAGEIADGDAYEWGTLPNLFLYSRADTIYGGTNQIQRNLIAERGLGLPREPRGDL